MRGGLRTLKRIGLQKCIVMDDIEHPGWKDLGQVRDSYDTTCLPRTVEEWAEILRDVLGGGRTGGATD